MIKFLKDRPTDERAFKAGETVEELSPESEFGHVRRGYAAFKAEDGTLTDHEGRIVTEAPKPAPETLKRRAMPRGASPAKPKARAKKPAAKKPTAKKAAAKAGGK